MRKAVRLAAVGCALLAAGCDWFEDRFQTCRDVRVELVNSEQTLGPIALAGPDEDFGPDSVLDSGASRDLNLCLQNGSRAVFRASREGQVVGTATCVLNRTPVEGDSVTVVWTLHGFLCQGW